METDAGASGSGGGRKPEDRGTILVLLVMSETEDQLLLATEETLGLDGGLGTVGLRLGAKAQWPMQALAAHGRTAVLTAA